jgi:signal transduction histidine kinase
MVQVFQNLITNAIQAMPDGGSIRLSAQQPAEKKIAHATPASDNRTGASLLDPNDFIEIAVADTGGGVSPENMKNLFQPLFTTKAKGIGLGLVVCRNLTEANGGTIEASSQYGTGTVFTVRFPRAIEEPVF